MLRLQEKGSTVNGVKLILLSGLVLVGLTLQSPWEKRDLQE